MLCGCRRNSPFGIGGEVEEDGPDLVYGGVDDGGRGEREDGTLGFWRQCGHSTWQYKLLCALHGRPMLAHCVRGCNEVLVVGEKGARSLGIELAMSGHASPEHDAEDSGESVWNVLQALGNVLEHAPSDDDERENAGEGQGPDAVSRTLAAVSRGPQNSRERRHGQPI